MGRKKLNRTKKELDKMNQKRRNRFYENHKEKERKKSLKWYYDKKKLSEGNKLFSSNT